MYFDERKDNSMILAEKIMNLRKKNGWSQEELADQLGISRQSVSKWESGASIPDLDKIIKMSGLFGVSTDYLLKDELEEISYSETDTVEEKLRSISVEEANTFLEESKTFAKWLAPTVAACILSPVILILLGGLSEYGSIGLTENMAGGIGTAILLVIIAVAVGLMIVKGIQYGKYDYLEKESITLQYGVQGIVQKKKEDYGNTFRTCVAIGVMIIILGVVPLMVAAAFDAGDLVYIICTDVLLVAVACGVFLFIRSGVVYGSFDKLLQQGDYTEENKKLNRKYDFFPGVYWCVVTAIFLAWGFITNDWRISGIIWPVAGVLFAAIMGILKAVGKSRE